MGNGNSNEVAEINKSMKNINNLSLPELQSLSAQIGGILGRGTIRTECTYNNYKEKYEITTRNGVEISRRFINSQYTGKSSKIESIPLSSDNKANLQAAQNSVNIMIKQIQNIHSSIRTLNKIGNNQNNMVDIGEALELTSNFLGFLEKEGKLSNRSDSLVRFVSFDGKRQVRWDINPKKSHCKGNPHFNFEILDNNYLRKLSNYLGFQVNQNYHLFLKIDK